MVNKMDSLDDSFASSGNGQQTVRDNKIAVLLCDDHPMLRAGLVALLDLEEDMAVGQATNGEEAVELVGRLRPDVVVMDIGLPGMDVLETSRRISSEYPQCSILTMYREVHYLLSALRSGALVMSSRAIWTWS